MAGWACATTSDGGGALRRVPRPSSEAIAGPPMSAGRPSAERRLARPVGHGIAYSGAWAES